MNLIIPTLSYLTVLAQIALAIYVVLVIFNFKWRVISDFISHYYLALSFAVALVATLGSLSFSEILGFKPCDLCWFQRIFMYPQAVILAIALYSREEKIRKYILGLSLIGLIIASYHIYIQFWPTETFCSASTGSCSAVAFAQFGYVTIPVMSATAFLLLLILSVAGKKKNPGGR